jgi:hypothetical protein
LADREHAALCVSDDDRPRGRARCGAGLWDRASIETTARIYLDGPTMDEIREAVDGVSFLGEQAMARPNLMFLSASTGAS